MLFFGVVRPWRILLQLAVGVAVCATLGLALAGRPSWWAQLPTVTAALGGELGGSSTVAAAAPAAAVGEVTLIVEPPSVQAGAALFRDGWKVGAFDGGPLTVAVKSGDVLVVRTPDASPVGVQARVAVLAVSRDTLEPTPGRSIPLTSDQVVIGSVVVR